MSKVTSKYQVTVPKAIAERYGIRPGDEITWEPAGSAIRVVPKGLAPPALSRDDRLRLFKEMTARHNQRIKKRKAPPANDRGWTREELYDRGGTC